MKGLVDSTLREGGQTVGVSFSLREKKNIFRALSRFGVEEIELGVVSRFDVDLPPLIKFCKRVAPEQRIALWCRCRRDDIIQAVRLRPDVLSLSIPASDLHITNKLGKNRNWIIKRVTSSVALAAKQGIQNISLGLEDATRADPEFLMKIAAAADTAGTFRIRLADTVGISSPGEMAILVKKLKQHLPALEIGVHCHNDFGMATANSLAAIDAGAHWADVTVLGIGERAGNARLEELAGYLRINRQRSYKVEELKSLCDLVAHCADRLIQPHHPVIGEKIFFCETGLHLQGLMRIPVSYEPFDPHLVGAERRYLFGAKVGSRAIEELVSVSGDPERKNVESLTRAIRLLSARLGRPLEENELSHLIVMQPDEVCIS